MGYSLSLLLILKESKHDCATTLHRKTTPMVAIDAVESTAFAYANCRVFRRSVAFGKFCPATRGTGNQSVEPLAWGSGAGSRRTGCFARPTLAPPAAHRLPCFAWHRPAHRPGEIDSFSPEQWVAGRCLHESIDLDLL